MRLNKYLSEYGMCSRRAADRAIEEGRVSVNGAVAVIGQDVEPGKDTVCFDGKAVNKKPERVVIAYNKPAGIVCSSVSQGKTVNDVISAVGFKERIFPVGRLDKDSRGLLLLTNDGDLSDRVLRGAGEHEKEYIVRSDSELETDEIERIRQGGIPIEEKRSTKPCRIEKKGKCVYTVILTEGMNRQIRKVFEYFGREVKDLKRVRFMNIRLGDLEEGKYRILSRGETDGLYKAL